MSYKRKTLNVSPSHCAVGKPVSSPRNPSDKNLNAKDKADFHGAFLFVQEREKVCKKTVTSGQTKGKMQSENEAED